MPFVWMEMAVCLRLAILPIPLTACQRDLPQLLNVTNKLDSISGVSGVLLLISRRQTRRNRLSLAFKRRDDGLDEHSQSA